MSLNDDLTDLLDPVVTDLGLELVGIEFAGSAGNSLLRIYIDEPDQGVTIDDCERVSREVSALLDVHDPIPGHYTLEVSSPGLERPLFTVAHFERFLGEVAKVTLARPLEGRRRFQGPVTGVEEGVITLLQDGSPVRFAHADVLKANLVPDYTALGMAPAAREGKENGKGRN